MTITNILAYLQHFNELRFLDLDFLPQDKSVYFDSNIRLDINIHWRKLIDFMSYQQDTPEELININ